MHASLIRDGRTCVSPGNRPESECSDPPADWYQSAKQLTEFIFHLRHFLRTIQRVNRPTCSLILAKGVGLSKGKSTFTYFLDKKLIVPGARQVCKWGCKINSKRTMPIQEIARIEGCKSHHKQCSTTLFRCIYAYIFWRTHSKKFHCECCISIRIEFYFFSVTFHWLECLSPFNLASGMSPQKEY